MEYLLLHNEVFLLLLVHRRRVLNHKYLPNEHRDKVADIFENQYGIHIKILHPE